MEKTTKSYAQRLKEGLPKTGGKAIGHQEAFKLMDRRHNVILRNVKEKTDTKDDKEKEESDLTNVTKILNNILKDEPKLKASATERIVFTRRLGKEGVRRPLLVRFKSTETRDEVLGRARNLKLINEKEEYAGWPNITMDPDLSKDQVEDLNKTFETARRKSLESAKNGEGRRYYVVGREIPKIRSRPLTEKELETAEEDARKAIRRAEQWANRRKD